MCLVPTAPFYFIKFSTCRNSKQKVSRVWKHVIFWAWKMFEVAFLSTLTWLLRYDRYKTDKTEVVPGFYGIERGIASVGMLPLWPPLHCGGLPCQKSMVISLRGTAKNWQKFKLGKTIISPDHVSIFSDSLTSAYFVHQNCIANKKKRPTYPSSVPPLPLPHSILKNQGKTTVLPPTAPLSLMYDNTTVITKHTPSNRILLLKSFEPIICRLHVTVSVK